MAYVVDGHNFTFRKKLSFASSTYLSASATVAQAVTTATGAWADFWLNEPTNGGFVRFAYGAGTTVYPFEVEEYDPTTEVGIWHVEVPLSSVGPTDIYIYYFDTGVAADGSNAAGTWDVDYAHVMHFNDNRPGGSDLTDSAGGADFFAPTATITAGIIGRGRNAGVYAAPTNGPLAAPGLTVEIWVNRTSDNGAGIVAKYIGLSGQRTFLMWTLNSGQTKLRVYTTTTVKADSGGFTIPNGVWTHIVGVYDGATVELYADGVKQGAGAALTGNTYSEAASALEFFRRQDTGAVHNGAGDEGTISTVGRSLDWIKARYHSGKQDWITIGVEESSGPITGTITLTDVTDRRIIQRANGVGSITVSGTYTQTPVSIEARLVYAVGGAQAAPWAVMDAAPAGGVFFGTMASIPEGGMYQVQARFSDDTSVVAAGVNTFGVGMLVLLWGQSNADKYVTLATTEVADPATSLMNGTYLTPGTVWEANMGPGSITLANALHAAFGVPVGIVRHSKGGSALRVDAVQGTGYWLDPAGQYSHAKTTLANAGGSVEYLVWIQGEREANKDGTISFDMYRAFGEIGGVGVGYRGLEYFIRQYVWQDVGNANPYAANVPFIISGLQSSTWQLPVDSAYDDIRRAQIAVANDVDGAYVTPSTDIPTSDGIHYTEAGFITLAGRHAEIIKQIGRISTYGTSAQITSYTKVDASTIDLHVRVAPGTVLDITNVDGFEVLDVATPVTVSSVTMPTYDTIRLALAVPLVGAETVRYQYGAFPNPATPAKDNTPAAVLLLPGGVINSASVISYTLKTRGGQLRPNLSGLRYAIYEGANPDDGFAPVDTGNTGSTDASGLFSVPVRGTTKLATESVWLAITSADGTETTRAQVTLA